MRILICTGNSDHASSLVAAATASAAARTGRKTLLTSIGPSHGLTVLPGLIPSSKPQNLAANLDGWLIDISGSMYEMVESIRPRLFSSLAHLSSDELPLIPGIDFLICLEGLRHAGSGYDMVVIDAGAHDTMLRVLSLPDSFRWLVRLLFGLDRGPGQSNASLNRALLPTSLLPAEWMGRLQDARMHLEHARDNAIAANHTTVRYVLRPDRAALHEARMAIPALYLHGLAVDAVIGGPLLPADATDTRLMPTVARQQAIIGEAERTWQPLPVLHLPLTQPENIDHFAALGQALYAGHRLEAPHPVSPPITHGDAKNPLLSIDLPGIQREALSLTISGDELIVQVGPYRRHVLLPDSLRGKNAIKASRDGNRLLVRLRQ